MNLTISFSSKQLKGMTVAMEMAEEVSDDFIRKAVCQRIERITGIEVEHDVEV